MSWPADKPKDAGLTHLASGESLLADQYICSPNDAARLMLEGNGNLTIFKLKGKPWQLNRRAKNVGVTLANQADSNLVLYDADGKPAGWASNTKGGEGSYLTVSDDGRALYTSSEGILLWSSNGKDVGGKGAPAPGSAEAEAEAAAPPAGESDAHDPPMVQGGDAAPASVEKEGSGVVQMASIAASGGVGDHPVEFIAEVKVNDLGFDFFSLLSFVSLSLSRAHASSKRLARKKKKKKKTSPTSAVSQKNRTPGSATGARCTRSRSTSPTRDSTISRPWTSSSPSARSSTSRGVPPTTRARTRAAASSRWPTSSRRRAAFLQVNVATLAASSRRRIPAF